MKLINLTPHDIRLSLKGDTVTITIPSSGLARVSTKAVALEPLALTVTSPEFGDVEYDTIPLSAVEYGAVEGLPEAQEGIGYIVSGMVAARVPHRSDVFAPDSGTTAIRKDGQIWAVRGLIPAKV
jgi:hypothetical protein